MGEDDAAKVERDQTDILSLLSTVAFLAVSRLVQMQAVIGIGHNCFSALEVCAQHKWMAVHPGDYGPGFHSILEAKEEDKHQNITGVKINVSVVDLILGGCC